MGQRPRAAWPLGLLGMLAMVAVIERGVADHWLQVGERRALAWRFSGQAAKAEATPARLLCLGDSLVKLGVLPHLIEKGLNLKTYNLAVPGGQAPSTDFLLRRALAAGVRPEAVIVDFHPNLLAAAPRFNTLVWPDLLTLGESIELAIHARDPNLFTAILLSRLLPSHKDRDGIRTWITSMLSGIPDPERAENIAMLRNWRVNAGAHIAPAVASPMADTWSRGAVPEHGRWFPHRANAAFLRHFLDLCADHQIRVFWLLPPTTPDWTDRRRRLGITADFERYIRGLMARYPNLNVIDGRDAGYTATVFRDSTHLHRHGAAILSHDLAGVLKQALDHPSTDHRWLPLPPFRMRSEDLALEDIKQSQRILTRGVSRRE